ncbi:hypothetical protein ACFL2T_00630 [Elusimicrobiota bacterium]
MYWQPNGRRSRQSKSFRKKSIAEQFAAKKRVQIEAGSVGMEAPTATISWPRFVPEQLGDVMRRLVLAVVLTSLTGCTVKRPLGFSSTSMGPGQEEVVGMASGKSGQVYVFGLPVGHEDYSLKSAMEDALNGTRAHTLINAFADEECQYIPLQVMPIVIICDIRLTGTAIRYKSLTANSYFEALGRPIPGEREEPLPVKPDSYSSIEAAYGYMLAMYATSPKEAAAYHKQLSPPLPKNLEEYVVSAKGEKVGLRWGFKLHETLPETEKALLRWYLQKYTYYRPQP